jgi:hypothetical protein
LELNYDQQVTQTWKTFTMDADQLSQMRALVYYATLAANGHNTQPWKFAIREDAIEIHPDYSRSLPVVDPHDPALWISLGCALENLMVAARAYGYVPDLTYPDTEDLYPRQSDSRCPSANSLFSGHPHAPEYPFGI